MRDLPVFPDLRAFLIWCEARGEYAAITEPVALEQAMTAVHRRVLERNGPVLRFDHPVSQGHKTDMSVVTNLFGTPERVAAGLGVTPDHLDDLGAFLAALRSPEPPDGARDALSRWPMLKAALATRPKVMKKRLFRPK